MGQPRLELLGVDVLHAHLRDELARNPFLAPTPRHLVAREHALTASAARLGLYPMPTGPVWAAAVDIGFPESVVTVLVLADGTTRLYFDQQGGELGAGEHPRAAAAGERLLALAGESVAACTPAQAVPRPEAGRVTVYLRTPAGTLGAEASAGELRAGGHPLSPVFDAALAVLAAVRD